MIEPEIILHPLGRILTWHALVQDGDLRVQQDEFSIRASEQGQLSGYAVSRRAAYLNGLLVLDPDRAKALAIEAGIFTEETA